MNRYYRNIFCAKRFYEILLAFGLIIWIVYELAIDYSFELLMILFVPLVPTVRSVFILIPKFLIWRHFLTLKEDSIELVNRKGKRIELDNPKIKIVVGSKYFYRYIKLYDHSDNYIETIDLEGVCSKNRSTIINHFSKTSNS